MKKLYFPRFSPSRLVLAVTIAQMASPSVLNAMDEIQKEDPHHDRALRGLVNNNLFSHEHFVTPDGKTAPIYCIKAATLSRTQRIHDEQMKRYAAANTPTPLLITQGKAPESSSSILGSVFYYPGYVLSGLYYSLPGWRSPSKLPTTVTTPPQIVQSPAPTSTPLSAADTIMSAQRDAQASSTTVSSPSLSIAAAEKDPQDFTVIGTSGRPRQRLLLSGSGGGIKGYGPARAIEYLEGKDGANMPISDLFDVVAGSSIGGIGALGLVTNNADGKPCLSGSEYVKLFSVHSEEVFPTTNPWNIPARIWGAIDSLRYPQRNPDKIERLLQVTLGITTTLGAARTRVMVTGLDSSRNMPLRINSIDNPLCLTWEAARGTSAAPTIYPAFKMTSLPDQPWVVDGGLWENSPAFEALLWDQSAAPRLSTQPYDGIVLALETGKAPVNSIPKNAGLLSVGSIVDACIQAQVNATDLTLKRVLKENETYFSFNPVLPFAVALDDPSEENYRMISAAFETQIDVLERFLQTEEVRHRLEAKGTK